MLDSGQSTLLRGRVGEDIVDVLLKIWLSVPNVLARIVVQKPNGWHKNVAFFFFNFRIFLHCCISHLTSC